ncbi:FliM/FliN family flagellar motor C-terminal domain-containing protein, partial [Yoonia sp.]|uniref:FliM/FliN family flagellar motor C-terminal domain-containing protein n=1 Tax=Yoonia sp. TaxID=2212373 RepID=UPI0019EFC404
ILWRKVGRVADDPQDQPLTAARAVRLAISRAANDTVGLVVTVQGIADDVLPLDGILEAINGDLMLIGLQRDDQLAGIIALDAELRTAVLEMQTVGHLIGMAAELRPATGTDKAMCDPLLDAIIQALPPAMAGTARDGWIDGCQTSRLFTSARAVGLVLADCDYQILRLTVDLGVADRQGLLLIALPPVVKPAVAAPTVVVDDLDWGSRLQQAVAVAPAELAAHLHTLRLPLAHARLLEAGQVLPLPGCDVHSVRLLAPDGKMVAQAKLGQLGGMRAVRIEQPPPCQMNELSPAGAGLPDATLLPRAIGVDGTPAAAGQNRDENLDLPPQPDALAEADATFDIGVDGQLLAD